MLNRLLNLIAPEVCLECGEEGSIWCELCRLQYEPLPSRCFLCHKQTQDYQTCKTCYSKTNLKTVYVYGEYSDINKLVIKSLKFKCKRHTAEPIAKSMAQLLPYYSSKPIFVNVGSSPRRTRQRGFDHTLVLAKELAKQTGADYAKLLIRNNDLRQVGAKRHLRTAQIKGAFRLKMQSKNLPDHIILVDDVVTTGATLAEATKTLKQAGAKRVDAITFAYSK